MSDLFNNKYFLTAIKIVVFLIVVKIAIEVFKRFSNASNRKTDFNRDNLRFENENSDLKNSMTP